MASAQGRTTIRRKPRQGDPGIAGCIHRQTVWAAGIEYRNDEAETTGTRFLDIVLVMTGVNAFNAFKCIKTHIAEASDLNTSTNVLTNTTRWQPFNSLLPVYTPFLLAPNAKITFLSGNEIQIMNADGTTVKALISGNGTGSNGIRFAAGINLSNLLLSKWYVDELGYMRSTSGKIAEFVISGNSLVSTYDERSTEGFPLIELKWTNNTSDKKGYIPMYGAGEDAGQYIFGGAFNVLQNNRDLREDEAINVYAAQAGYVVKSNRDVTGQNRDFGFFTNCINWSKRNFEQQSVACAVYEDETPTWHIDAIKTSGVWSDAALRYDVKPELFDFVYSSNWLLSDLRASGNTFSFALPHKGDLLRFMKNSITTFMYGETFNMWHVNNRLSFVFKIVARYDSKTFVIRAPDPVYPDPNETIWMNSSGTRITGEGGITLQKGNSLEILFSNGIYQLIKANI